MVVNLYSCYDRVSHTYSEPFVAVNEGVAKRRFDYVMSQSKMVAFDMQLFLIGTMNTDTGEIVPCNQFVCNYDVKEESK